MPSAPFGLCPVCRAKPLPSASSTYCGTPCRQAVFRRRNRERDVALKALAPALEAALSGGDFEEAARLSKELGRLCRALPTSR